MFQWLKNLFSPPEPAGPPRTIKRFDNSEATIADALGPGDDGWHFETREARSIRLFELDPGDVENGMLSYRAEIRSEDLTSKAYLEMWCKFERQGEFFSRGLHNALKGSNDWASYEIPFYLKKEQNPDLLKLNLKFEGAGKIWIRNIEVTFTQFK